MWGTFLALVREQLSAIEKHAQGRLGIWGKARFASRNKEMQKFLSALMDHKAKSHGEMTMEALKVDLEFIQNDISVWDDITPAEIDYVRSVLDDD